VLYTVKQLRQIEEAALASSGPGVLMRAAGKAAAETAQELLSKSLLNKDDQSILIFAGPGNNGGDALEVAVHLDAAGYKVFVLHHPPKSTMSKDCQQAFNQAKLCTQLIWLKSDIFLKKSYTLVVDGLFGIGLNSQPMSPVLQRQIEEINALHSHPNCSSSVLALDVPSGLSADTGNLISAIAIKASHTITFIADKPGLHTGSGRDYAGIVSVNSLGIAAKFFPPSDIGLNDINLFPTIFQPRLHNSNKGSHGTVTTIGGATGMQGALVLASRAALHSGAGRVIAGFVESPPNFDVQQPEIMCRAAQQTQFGSDSVVVIGPGLGQSSGSADLVSSTLLNKSPLVIDADALNLLAKQPALRALCNSRDPLSTLLTPHPLEAARLLGCSVDLVQADRICAARRLAQQYSAVVILKGSGSIIAHPNGTIVINPTGNAGLATGGTGDVLAGVCGSLIAQHENIWEAALAATWLHGAAADALVAKGIGPVGLCAGELLAEVRKILNSDQR
jgi:hydroxyethylthiazole kinase-like uncharacterized protein yjeF